VERSLNSPKDMVLRGLIQSKVIGAHEVPPSLEERLARDGALFGCVPDLQVIEKQCLTQA
jgi:hypothetical protein